MKDRQSQESSRTIAGVIARQIGGGKGLFLALGSITVLLASSAAHENPWHMLSAFLVGSTVGLLAVGTIAATDRWRGRDLRLRWVDRASLGVFVAGMYVPFTLMVFRGVHEWIPMSLVGAMSLLWVVVDSLVVFRRRSIVTMLWLAVIWTSVALAHPFLEAASPLVVVASLVVGLVASLLVLVDAVRAVPQEWAPWLRHEG